MSRVTEQELPGNPMGELPVDTYTTAEVKFIENNGIGEFKMIDGWFATLRGGVAMKYPFKDIMDDLYQKRSISPMAKTMMKLIANSLVGKLIETRAEGGYGVLFNNIYHAMILAETRISIARFLIANEVQKNELVTVQTDGVKLTRKIDLSSSNRMGSWQYKGSAPCIVASPRKILTGDKKPYQYTYADLVKQIEEHPGSDRYTMPVRSRILFKDALRIYDDVTRVGEFIDRNIDFDLIDIEREQTRVFRKLPKTGRALLSGAYPSEPFIL